MLTVRDTHAHQNYDRALLSDKKILKFTIVSLDVDRGPRDVMPRHKEAHLPGWAILVLIISSETVEYQQYRSHLLLVVTVALRAALLCTGVVCHKIPIQTRN